MTNFSTNLQKLHRQRQLGKLGVLLLSLTALLGISLLILGIADYHYALSSGTRRTALTLIIFTLLGIAAYFTFRNLRTPKTTTAQLADKNLTDDRATALAASHLADKKAQTPMEEYHLKRTLSEANAHLEKLPTKAKLPVKALAIGATSVIAALAAILITRNAAPEPFAPISDRIISPSSDTPPYSPLKFAITPNNPTAIYQGEATAQVHITGGEITGDVHCLIRNPATGNVETVTTYREQPGKYARKFENALAPLEFAFATGRARSAWHKLDILFQPRIASAQITITPPSYTGENPISYPLDSGEIKALEGSTITLQISSNRPLNGGTLSLQGMDQESDNPIRQIEATLDNEKQANFTWVAHRSAKITALIRDIRDTPADSPLQLIVKTTPDQAPLLSIDEPSSFVLATPKSTLPILADIEDDYGLNKITLTRTLVGFRDRSHPLAEGLAAKTYEYKQNLTLAELGVEPGQIIELYLEATDRNPSLLGVGVSDITRIQIISEEDYAQRIRNRITMKNFTARYRALKKAIDDARQSIVELEEAENGTEEEKEKALRNAERIHDKARLLAKKIGADFQAFDTESQLKDAANEAVETLAENLRELGNLPTDPTTRKLAIENLKERLGGVAEKAEQIEKKAQAVKEIGDVLEMAAQYRKLINNQESLITRIFEVAKEVAKGNTESTARLEGLARVQEKNRDALNQLAKDLKERAAKLPDEAFTLQADAEAFLEKLAEMNIPEPMDATAASAREGKTNNAHKNAVLVLQLMNRLIEDPDNSFNQAAKGKVPPLFQGNPDIANTMAQMLNALMNRANQGQGQGGGQRGQGGGPPGQGAGGGQVAGGGGGGGDGHSSRGDHNTPAYGPDRLNFENQSTPTESQLAGKGGSLKRTRPGRASDGVDPEQHRKTETQDIVPENIPAKYQDAVKKYFTAQTTP